MSARAQKIALVALLTLMVAVIVKFAKNMGEANTLQSIAKISRENTFGQKIQVFDVSEENRSKTLNDILAQAPNIKYQIINKIIIIVFSEPNK